MAAKFGVPVCPHAGGVGLCEMVQHLSMFDYIAVTGTMERRVTEFVDHLHEHFVDPVVIKKARYMPPGYSTEIRSGVAQRIPLSRWPCLEGERVAVTPVTLRHHPECRVLRSARKV